MEWDFPRMMYQKIPGSETFFKSQNNNENQSTPKSDVSFFIEAIRRKSFRRIRSKGNLSKD